MNTESGNDMETTASGGEEFQKTEGALAVAGCVRRKTVYKWSCHRRN